MIKIFVTWQPTTARSVRNAFRHVSAAVTDSIHLLDIYGKMITFHVF